MLDLFTIVWGKMISFYLDVTLPCLLQDGNLPAAKGLVDRYTIYASSEAKDRITNHLLYPKLCSLTKVEWEPLRKEDANSNLVAQMKKASERKNHMLGAGPDSAIGNYSIFNMAKLSTTPHILFNGSVKISYNGLMEIKSFLKEKGTISNRELVSASMKHVLGAAYEFVKTPGQEYWRVTRSVYSPCFIPDQKIIDFYIGNPTPASGYDHVLPYWLVKNNYPWKIVGDSDVYFIAEAEFDQSMKVGAGTWHPEMVKPSQEFFSQFTGIWRGKEAQ